MRRPFPIPFLLLPLTMPLCIHAQGALPPAQPTQQSAPISAPAPHHHVQVLYSAGTLTIHAENASLNGILRDISAATGMSISGGVTDERVYGSYGPANTGTILEALLAGTGSNMLLEESTQDRPLTLVLTPRQGGASPPNPSTFAAEPQDPDDRDHTDLPPQQVRPTPRYAPIAPTSPQPEPATTPASETPIPAPTTDQQSPNGVKTPQQIYDQLMKLKQQQQQAQPAPQ